MKLKPWVKVFLGIIIIMLIILIAFKFISPKKDENKNKTLLEKYNIPLNKDSKTLEKVLEANMYDEKYLDEYSKINYLNNENFLDIITTFLPKGYKGEEINYILKLSASNIEKLKNKDYLDISNYYKIKNFNVDNMERYENYLKKNKYSYEDIVTYVNINLDLPVYTDVKTVTNSDSELVLVNKYNCLPKSFNPTDIAYLKGAYGNNVPMRKVAKEALEKLQKAVKEEINIELLPTTAYRDYNFQNTLYNNYVAKDGVAKADTYSARPGCSEHQTGLAIDLKNPQTPSSYRLNPSDYEWLKTNAHRFGFIIRFPKDNEFITGYQEENWHIRYVGIEAATTIFENNLTLEEYIDLYETAY